MGSQSTSWGRESFDRNSEGTKQPLAFRIPSTGESKQ